MSFMLLGILNSQAAGGGDPSSFDLLSSTTLTSAPASFTFSGLAAYAADYKHLQVRLLIGSNASAQQDGLQIKMNNNGSPHYSRTLFTNHGGTIQAGDQNGPASMNFSDIIPGGSINTNIFGANILDIYDFASASKATTLRGLHGHTGSSQGNAGISMAITTYNAAITQITFNPWNGSAFRYGSRFAIYGVR